MSRLAAHQFRRGGAGEDGGQTGERDEKKRVDHRESTPVAHEKAEQNRGDDSTCRGHVWPIGGMEDSLYVGYDWNSDMNDYVEKRNGGYFVSDTRVSLDSVVTEFRRGRSPEAILESFPMLGSLVRVYGAITYYLEHETEIDDYLEKQGHRWAELRKKHPLPQALKEKIERAKREMEAHRR